MSTCVDSQCLTCVSDSDDDCAEGEHCEYYEDQPVPGSDSLIAPMYGKCVPDSTEPMCYSSDNCAANEFCSVEIGDCYSACNSDPGSEDGIACPAVCMGYCLPKEEVPPCGDTVCAPGERCNDCPSYPGCPECDACGPPVCEPAGCYSDADCAAGQVCIGTAECPPDGDCGIVDGTCLTP